MSEINEELYHTTVISLPSEQPGGNFSPRLFVCEGHSITEYALSGEQRLGRPSPDAIPEIPINDFHVSRMHGVFRTEGSNVTYTAQKTTNGILLNGRRMEEGDCVMLKDGDELSIPTGELDRPGDILITCALSESRIRRWQGLQNAGRDKLTALSNREGFSGWWLRSCKKSDYTEACLFILDIDNFKSINDSQGHSTGDEALKALTDIMRAHVRSDSQICRWGGDEFVGIIPGKMAQVKQRLLLMKDEVSALAISGGTHFTISIGLVSVDEGENRLDIEELVALADRALYQAKGGGKDRICVYPGELQ